MPIRHQYSSQVWQHPTAFSEQVGEVLGAARLYSKGVTPAGAHGLGYCGDQWMGQLVRRTTPIPMGDDGFPLACPRGPITCISCTGGVGSDVVQIVAQGGTGDFAVCNGTWTVRNRGPGTCSWTLIDPGPPFWAVAGGAGWDVAFANGATSATWQAPFGWDCYSLYTPFALFSHTGSGVPPAVSVQAQP